MKPIDAEALIAELDILRHKGKSTYEEIIDLIRDQPKADPAWHWIRCKDRKPEKEGLYLVTLFSGEFTFIDIATYVPGHDNWVKYSLKSWGNVVAWMELPEPITYEEVDDLLKFVREKRP